MKQVSPILFSADQIHSAVVRLGRELHPHYAENPENLLVICVLNGAAIFAADLIRNLGLPTVEIEYIRASSYGKGTESKGTVDFNISKELFEMITGRDVLLVEDIVDTGLTVSQLSQVLAKRVKTLRVASLLHKPTKTKHDVPNLSAGFVVQEDAFVVGYGLDYAGKYRNLPYIATLE